VDLRPEVAAFPVAQWRMATPLVTYRCGGSAGLAPASLFHPPHAGAGTSNGAEHSTPA